MDRAEGSVSPARPLSIVSLAPSMTEILFGIGLGPNLEGVTIFCDYPPEAMQKPKVGGMSNPSLEAVVAIRPDIVMMTTNGNPEGFDRRLRSMGIRTYVSKVRSIYGIAGEIRRIGEMLGAGARAGELAGEIESTLGTYRAESPKGKKVIFIIWPEPLIVAGPGTEADDVVRLLGYENIAAGAGINYPRYSVEEAMRQRPDFVIISGGKGMENKVVPDMALKLLAGLPPDEAQKRVVFVGDSLLRLGPRLIEGIKELAAALEAADADSALEGKVE